MAGITVKVTPDMLKRKAGDINREITRIEKALQNIGEQIRGSKKDWEGDAGNAHQQRYNALKDEIANVIRELKAHPRNLLQMAGLYSAAESSAVSTADTLSADVIT